MSQSVSVMWQTLFDHISICDARARRVERWLWAIATGIGANLVYLVKSGALHISLG